MQMRAPQLHPRVLGARVVFLGRSLARIGNCCNGRGQTLCCARGFTVSFSLFLVASLLRIYLFAIIYLFLCRENSCVVSPYLAELFQRNTFFHRWLEDLFRILRGDGIISLLQTAHWSLCGPFLEESSLIVVARL